jgi:hypothetical protein
MRGEEAGIRQLLYILIYVRSEVEAIPKDL